MDGQNADDNANDNANNNANDNANHNANNNANDNALDNATAKTANGAGLLKETEEERAKAEEEGDAYIAGMVEEFRRGEEATKRCLKHRTTWGARTICSARSAGAPPRATSAGSSPGSAAHA